MEPNWEVWDRKYGISVGGVINLLHERKPRDDIYKSGSRNQVGRCGEGAAFFFFFFIL